VLEVELGREGSVVLRKKPAPGFFDQFVGLRAKGAPFASGDQAREELRLAGPEPPRLEATAPSRPGRRRRWMSVALDSNILLDVLGQPTGHTPHAVAALNAALGRGALIICPIVAAETSLYFDDASEAEDTFRRMQIRLLPFEWIDLHLAGRIFRFIRKVSSFSGN